MPFHVLFLCTGNSARSILAEALLGVIGEGRFAAFSAGSHPAGQVRPFAVELAVKFGYPAEKLRSKSWDEYAAADAPSMDFIITVCDNAAGEICPIWPGHPVSAHWGVADPAAVAGDDAARRLAYRDAFLVLRRRVELLVALPDERLRGLAAGSALREIAESTS